jgi:hypothetical protein
VRATVLDHLLHERADVLELGVRLVRAEVPHDPKPRLLTMRA